MHLNNQLQTTLANFTILKNNQIQKKFKKPYEHLFKPKLFTQLLTINQKNIIKLHDIDKENETLTYEYFESKTLRECLKLNTPINSTRLKNILRDIAIAIDYLHINNIAHIDINDTNCLVNNHFQVKLNDFDFIEIITEKNIYLKKIDIHSYIVLVYRIIQLPQQWNAIKALQITFEQQNLNYSSCIAFFNSLNMR